MSRIGSFSFFFFGFSLDVSETRNRGTTRGGRRGTTTTRSKLTLVFPVSRSQETRLWTPREEKGFFFFFFFGGGGSFDDGGCWESHAEEEGVQRHDDDGAEGDCGLVGGREGGREGI